MPAEAPSVDASAGDVSRANGHVGSLHAVDQSAEVPGIVAEVGIHIEHEIVAVRNGVPKSGEHRGTEAFFARPMQDANPTVGSRQLVGDASRSVGGVIVDHQHVGFGQDLPNLRHQEGNVVPLVVRAKGDQNARVGHDAEMRENDARRE